MHKYDVYGIGAALVDTEIEIEDHFLASAGIEKGMMTLVDEDRQNELLDVLSDHLMASRRASGGSGANSVIAAACFGGTAYYACKVADDDNGRFYADDMRRAGVDSIAEHRRFHGTTGKCLVLISPDAERTMNTYLGISSELSTDEIDEEAIRQSKYVYIEGYQVTSPTGRAAAIRVRELAEQHGVKTSLSFSDPGIVAHFRDGLTEMVGSGVDLLFCNEQEALEWTGADSVEEAGRKLSSIARQWAITLGSEGALINDGRNVHRIASHPVKAIDTNGAGDMFAGAYLFGITNGFDAALAGQLASRAAAELVTHYGPRLPPARYKQILAEFNAERG